MNLGSEKHLAASCFALLGTQRGLTAIERQLIQQAAQVSISSTDLSAIRRDIEKGHDPLGDTFSKLRSSQERRATGAIYTPRPIVQSMLKWLGRQETPGRVVDPGAGSGRFILAAARAFPEARLYAIEKDPLAALTLRANLHVAGCLDRTKVLVEDYRLVTLPRFSHSTAFVGNPPYVRHHDVGAHWKEWYSARFAGLGIKASGLAGLHLHFFLQTCLLAKPGDIGAFITSAEWMDVNYGAALRRLLLEHLGGVGLHVLEPSVEAFPGTATTAAIACFRVGETSEPVQVRSVENVAKLGGLASGAKIPRSQLQEAPKWSIIVRPTGLPHTGDLEIGELFRVHRGQVTGANSIWIAGEHAQNLPDRVKLPAVTKARDLIQAGSNLKSVLDLKRVIDLPESLDEFDSVELRHVEKFLAWARLHGADLGYVAQHRRAWWSVGLKAPAPILCTYMARRAPQFTLNACDARHINIAHGLYPREPIPGNSMAKLVAWLNSNVHTGSGRTYAGGLTKFEPKEVERLRIPRLDMLL